jgi:aminobenzoyl-glutamate utilization protein B
MQMITQRLTRAAMIFAALVAPAFAQVAQPEGAPAFGEFRPTQQTALAEVDARADQIKAVNKTLWQAAEVGLQEVKSSKTLRDALRDAGFSVEAGVAGMPTAFVASYGKGRPIVGILAEYDALPGMSQKLSPRREPVVEGANGHACGHCGLGSGALGAALAVKAAIQKHHLPGTIRLYGTPAEETVIGKIYMTLDGQFDDLDACLHWHPADSNQAWDTSSKAMVSAKFTFHGTAAHASVSPESGRSALDAVELMDVGANYMREHIKEDARIHYVITDGGGAPNVVPPTATVWYFCRADSHKDVEYNFAWLKEIAKGAAMMTKTTVTIKVETDCHEVVPNGPISERIVEYLKAIGPPTYTADEIAFARKLQAPLTEQFGTTFPRAIDTRVLPVDLNGPPSKGSTDVGDISWRIATGGLRTACMADGSPGHSWQNVACIGSTIGEKGILYASKALAVTALDLLEDKNLLTAARADWKKRMEGRKYVSLIPEGQKAPAAIR